MNYLDRFLSAYEIPVSGGIRGLLSTLCVLLHQSPLLIASVVFCINQNAEWESLDYAIVGCGMFVACSQNGGD